MDKIELEKNFYTTKELAEILQVSKQSVIKRIHNGSIRGQKMGRDFIIFKKDININKLQSEIKH